MHEHEPPRLKDAEGTSDALNRALSALRKGPDDAARLARVSKQLEAYLDAVPPTVTEPAALRPALTGLKLLAGGALLVAPLLWLAYTRFGAQTVQPSAALPSPPSTTVSAAGPVAVPPTAAPVEPSPTPTAAQIQPTEGARPHAHGALAAHGKPGRRATSAAHHASMPARAAEPGPSGPHALEPSEAAASPVQPAAKEPAAPPQPQPKREPASADKGALASRAPTESELLFDARKALPGDAQLALRLLSEHASRYPKGQLVPEREVLAIEALRKLGRTQEADARLQRFQARYPNSLHLQRLQR
jgi:hypothetical protein